MTPADQIYSVPTNLGAAKLSYALANNLTVKLTAMALGDGNGVNVKPDASWTALKKEVYRAQLNSLAQSPNNPNWLVAELAIPAETGGWTIREIGLYDDAGDLIFVGNHPEQYKPQQSQGSDEVKVVRMVILISSLAAVTLKTDPSTIMATLNAVDLKIAAHKAEADPHSKYLLRSAVAAASGTLAWLGTAGGAANGLTFTLASTEAKLTAYEAGQRFQFKAAVANTGAVTAKIGSLAAVAIKKGGDTALVDLDAGDIKPGAVYDLNFDGAVFQLGGGVGGGKAFERFPFTASIGQTEFAFTHTAGSVIVYRNGREIDEFTSDGTKVVLTRACDIDDRVEFLAFRSFKVVDTYTKAEITALLQTASALPIGAMLPFPRALVPAGFLEIENDTLYSAAQYPDGAAYLGSAFKRAGDPDGYFRLPESRAVVLRGWDHGRGVDVGRELGTEQLDAIQNIVGSFNAKAAGPYAPTGPFASRDGTVISGGSVDNTSPGVEQFKFDASLAVRTAAETRVRSLSVIWCMKIWNAPVNQGQIDVASLAASTQAVIASQSGGLIGLRGWASGLSSVAGYMVSEAMLRAPDGQYKRLNDLLLSINLAAAGLNGLDTGVVAVSSWYSTWAVWNPATGEKGGIAALCPVMTGTTAAGSAVITGLTSTATLRVGAPFMGGSLPAGVVIKSIDSPSQITASRSATAAGSASLCFLVDPVMPAGFTHKARVGMVFTDATASKFPLAFVQFGPRVQYALVAGSNLVAYPLMATGAAGNPNGQVFVPVALAAFVPPTASSITVSVGTTTSSSQANVSPNPLGGVRGSAPAFFNNGTSGDFYYPAEFLLEFAYLYYAATSAGFLRVLSWEDTL